MRRRLPKNLVGRAVKGALTEMPERSHDANALLLGSNCPPPDSGRARWQPSDRQPGAYILRPETALSSIAPGWFVSSRFITRGAEPPARQWWTCKDGFTLSYIAEHSFYHFIMMRKNS